MNLVDYIILPFTINSDAHWLVIMAILVSLPCALIGCFLNLRKMSLIGDAISHSVLPGIVIAFLIIRDLSSPWLILGATLSGLLSVIIIEMIHQKTKIKQDAAIGISFTSLFAIGVLLISVFVSKQTDLHVDCIISGDLSHLSFYKKVELLGVLVPKPLIQAFIITLSFIIALMLFFRLLSITSFDQTLAQALGISTKWTHYILTGTLSLLIVSSFQAVGAILIIALLIIPSAFALLCSNKLKLVLLLAATHAISSCIIGYYLFVYFNSSYAVSIVVAEFFLFLVAWMFGLNDGVLTKILKRKLSNPQLDV